MLPLLEELFVADNHISGTLPHQAFTLLKKLVVSKNALVGSMLSAAFALRLGWPAAAERETGPEPKVAAEMAGGLGKVEGPKMWLEGKWPATQKLAKFWLSSHLPGHFRDN